MTETISFTFRIEDMSGAPNLCNQHLSHVHRGSSALFEKNQAQSSDKAPLSPEQPHLLPNTTSDGFIHAHNVANNLTLAVMMALK